MFKKMQINQGLLWVIVLLLFFIVISCSPSVKNCKIKPDLERIGESAAENIENLAETDLRSAKMHCNF